MKKILKMKSLIFIKNNKIHSPGLGEVPLPILLKKSNYILYLYYTKYLN
jgi:hypothetical protein